MAGWRRVSNWQLSCEEIESLTALSRSRIEPASRVSRKQMLLAYRENPSFCAVGQRVGGSPSNGSALRGAGAGLWAAGGDRGSANAKRWPYVGAPNSPRSQPAVSGAKIPNYDGPKVGIAAASAVGLRAQGWPPGTEFLDAETKCSHRAFEAKQPVPGAARHIPISQIPGCCSECTRRRAHPTVPKSHPETTCP